MRSRVPGGQPAISGGRVVDQSPLVQELGQPQLGGGRGRIVGDPLLPQQQPLGPEKVLLGRELLDQPHNHGLGGRMKGVQLGKPLLHWPIEVKDALGLAGKHEVDASPFGGRQLLPDLEQASGDPSVEVNGDMRIVRAGIITPRRSVIASFCSAANASPYLPTARSRSASSRPTNSRSSPVCARAESRTRDRSLVA